jgi:hypothetical protein
MTAQSIVCGACAAEVPYGRLSCPSCGELLASVAGSRRTISAATGRSKASARAATLPDVLYDPGTAPAIDVNGSLKHDQRDEADDADEDDGLLGLLADDDVDPDPEPAASGSTTGGPAWAIAGASLTGPATPAYMPRPNRARDATSMPSAGTPAAVPIASTPMPASPAVGALAPDLPGAYVPPPPAAVIPAGPAGPARAWVGHTNGTDPDHAARDDAGLGAIVRPSVDASRLAEFVGSVSVAGAALASVGFLLPWASVVIGSTGSGYFDRWGLAGPGHIVVVLGTLAILLLSIVRNPVPSWIRTGIGGLGVGALLLGLAWPYLLNPALEAAPGVLIESVGALALILAGVLAIATDRRTDRHAGAPEVV